MYRTWERGCPLIGKGWAKRCKTHDENKHHHRKLYINIYTYTDIYMSLWFLSLWLILRVERLQTGRNCFFSAFGYLKSANKITATQSLWMPFPPSLLLNTHNPPPPHMWLWLEIGCHQNPLGNHLCSPQNCRLIILVHLPYILYTYIYIYIISYYLILSYHWPSFWHPSQSSPRLCTVVNSGCSPSVPSTPACGALAKGIPGRPGSLLVSLG